MSARSLVTATDNCGGTINWDCDAGEVTENGCYRSQIFTLTASDVCDNSAQCQVTYNWKEDHNAPTFRDCPESAIELGCNPQNLPTCNDALALVGASDNCDGNITPSCEPSDITAIGCKRSQTFTLTATDDCGNHTDCAVTYTWTIDNPPVITCPATLNLLCGQSTAPSVYPTATDDCGAVPTFSYQDVSIPATCGGTAGSAYSRVWTATGGCGLTASCTQTVTCGPCVTVCGLTQGFYGSTNGKFKGYTALEIIHNTLNSSGAMVLGLPGRSLTVNPSAIGCTPTCINSLMPAGGQAAKLPAGNMVLSTGSCCVPNNNTWRKNGKFASVLWGQAVTLWMNAHMDANFGSMTLNHACIAKPALLNGVADVAGLLDFTNKALGGYVFPSLGRELNNSELGILAGYLGDLHNYFDNCKLDCNHYYYDDPHNRPSGGRDQEPEQIETKEIVQVNDFKVVPNPMWDQFTVTLDKESVGKAVSIMVFNQFGQIVLAENQTALSSEEVQLTASKLPAGIYQISVRVENQHPMAKTIVVIKQ